MLDYALFVCVIVAVGGTGARISIALTALTPRPQRIEWDDPVEADA
ncbi:hypothetical protein [Methylobacterium sp. J-077]|nr:hypothetical protein [Methylobacterium sp. J-077]MCJ2121367.1 hypothetical protein [Methylobacterium sp. J-077]